MGCALEETVLPCGECVAQLICARVWEGVVFAVRTGSLNLRFVECSCLASWDGDCKPLAGAAFDSKMEWLVGVVLHLLGNLAFPNVNTGNLIVGRPWLRFILDDWCSQVVYSCGVGIVFDSLGVSRWASSHTLSCMSATWACSQRSRCCGRLVWCAECLGSRF